MTEMIDETMTPEITAAELLAQSGDRSAAPLPEDDDALPWETDAPGTDAPEEQSAPDVQPEDGGDAPDGDDPGEPGEPQDAALPDEAQCRDELAKLLENGFTIEEIRAFSQDAASQLAVACGMSIPGAAIQFLRRQGAQNARAAAPVRRGVPTVRSASAGERSEGNLIEQMSDEQFRSFSRRAMDAMLAGRRVRVE